MRALTTIFMVVLMLDPTSSLVHAQAVGTHASAPAVGALPASTSPPVADPDKCTSHNKADYGEKNYIGDLGKNWSVGSKATASFFRYNLASEKASFNEKTLGVGLSFRYYTDSQLSNAGKTSIEDVPKACRARTEDLLDFSRSKSDGTLVKVGSWISISPTLFVSKAETEGDVAIQPAIVVGFLNDIFSIGTAYNLTGTGKGQWSILIGPSYGFQW